MEEGVNAFKNLIGKFTGNRPLEWCRWDGNIRMNLKGIGISTRNWVDSALDRYYWKVLANGTLNFWVP